MRQIVFGRIGAVALMIAFQAAAAVYFIGDALAESGLLRSHSLSALFALDLLVGLAMLVGIAMSARAYGAMRAEARRHAEALAAARGALADLIRARFGQWGLSPGEGDVALFALKGFTPTEIAALRGSAQGTVRAQLSAVYAKAGVSGQPMLMALFLDDLLE